ncbi:MAG: hypothetical protein OEY64_01320 [Nitrospinota bacterium]|nr:hypothetical protein [Nitrospinota bacterium]
MKARLILFVSAVIISAFALSASAQQPPPGDGMHKGMHEGMHGDMHKPMDPAAMEEMRKKMAEGRKEMHAIMQDTISLIKDMAQTGDQKKRAEALEKRIQAHIDSMESMHMDHKMMKGK